MVKLRKKVHLILPILLSPQKLILILRIKSKIFYMITLVKPKPLLMKIMRNVEKLMNTLRIRIIRNLMILMVNLGLLRILNQPW